ncbi:MAG: CoA-transferase family protein [Deltaproteobacteria bacterium]|nr:CoA-transferase family protein [Deltaproteobacteria bacterium]
MKDSQQAKAQQPPPLWGIRVLDLTRIIAGPYCAMVLGDLGAEVIKIEQPKIGDESRAWGPPWVGETVSAYFTAINRNKKSLTLNFKKPEGIEIFKKLVGKSDVVLENFRPGTMDELGIGYEVLRRINPRLVYCDMTGYGTNGPYRDKPGVDVIVSAIGGLMAITGSAEGEPVKVGVPLTDVLTGIYSFGAISSALLLREKTGLGQRISCNLLAMQLATLINIGANYLVGGIVPRRWGSAHPNIVPYEAHQAKDGYLIFGIINERMWKSLCEIAEFADLKNDDRFIDNGMRIQNRQPLKEILDRIISKKPLDEWIPMFDRAGIPCGPVNTFDRVFKDPQVLHSGLVQEVEHPQYGKVKVVGPPATFSDSRIGIQSPPPMLGEHNREILTGILGYPENEVEKLRLNEVI